MRRQNDGERLSEHRKGVDASYPETLLNDKTVIQATRNPEQQYFSYEQAGLYIGKSAEAIRAYVARGLLRVKTIGGNLRFISKNDLDRFAG